MEKEQEEEGEQEEEEEVETQHVYNEGSNIIKCDGADMVSETSESEYNTEDEAYTDREAAVLVLAAVQPPAGQPLVLGVD